MDLSVIIPTRNRCKLLEKTLESITRQTLDFKIFEVIVVDNGSDDNTKLICDKYFSELQLVYIYEPKPGLHEGRHAGMKASKSEILVFCDDDIEAFPEWLESMIRVFNQDSSIAMVGGKNLPKFESVPPFWVLEEWNNLCQYGNVLTELSILDFGDKEIEISPYFVFGCNFGIRKKILVEANGFHPDGMPFELIRFRGDGETYVSKFVLDKGFKTIYSPSASVYHFVSKDRLTKEYFKKRRYIQGVSDAYTFLRNGHEKSTSSSDFFAKVKYLIKRLFPHSKDSSLKYIYKTDFEKDKEKSYLNGYNYLVSCYNMDEEIRKWVHKKNYL